MKRIIPVALALILLTSTAVADTPTTIMYQGRITDSLGQSVPDDDYLMKFSIYDGPDGGATELWNSDFQVVAVADGLFNYELGSNLPLPNGLFDDTIRYLGVIYDTNPEMVPRTRFLTVPYALRVSSIDNASGGRINGGLSVGGSNIFSSFAFVAGSGNDATASLSTAWGGQLNSASGDNSGVFGGENNNATGHNSVVLGGSSNSANGRNSLAAGYGADANHNNTFVWSDEPYTVSTDSNQFIIGARNGVGINTGAPEASLHVREGSAGAVTSIAGTVATFERNGNAYLSVLAPNSDASGILFGNPDANNSGGIIYNGPQSPKGLNFRTSGGTIRMVIDSNGDVGIGDNTPDATLDVLGDICYSGTIGGCSDERFKMNVTKLSNSLRMVTRMRGVRYRWNTDAYPDHGFDDSEHLGFIAQEIEPLFPEMVMTGDDGYKSVDYSRLTPVLVEAIKEQQGQIDSQKDVITEQQKQIELLTERMAQVEQLVRALSTTEVSETTTQLGMK